MRSRASSVFAIDVIIVGNDMTPTVKKEGTYLCSESDGFCVEQNLIGKE